MGDRAKRGNPPSGFRGRVVSSGDSQVSNGNIANIITIVRILLAPLFVWLVLLDGGYHGVLRLVAAALFIAAIATFFGSNDRYNSYLYVAFTIPAILLTAVAGVFVDRWNRRAVLVITNVLRAIFVAFLIGVRSIGEQQCYNRPT